MKWKNLKGGEVRFFITIERCIKKRKTSKKSPKIGERQKDAHQHTDMPTSARHVHTAIP